MVEKRRGDLRRPVQNEATFLRAEALERLAVWRVVQGEGGRSVYESRGLIAV